MIKQLITVSLQRRVGVESLAGAVINLICSRIELLLAIARQIPRVSELLSHPTLRWLTARQRHFMTRTPHSHHSPEFKEQALLKARHRGTRSVISIAGELNMAAGTLRKWLQSSGKAAGTKASYKPTAALGLDGSARAWSPAQRLLALQESHALSEVARAGWCREHGVDGDQRPSGKRRYVCPPNKLREDERLADKGVYVASESTMYRLLRQEGQLAHRRSERAAHSPGPANGAFGQWCAHEG